MIESFALVTFGISATYLTMPAAIRAANRIGAIDRPNPAKLHFRTVACAGGLSIFVTVLFAIALLCVSGCVQSQPRLGGIGLGAALVFLAGVVDDIRGIGPRTKLTVQVAAASVLFAAGIHAGSLAVMDVPPVLDLAITAVWIVLITNGFNFIDGLDGLAAGASAICGLALGALFLSTGHQLEAGIALALAGAAIGFMPYNIAPAKSFMGDSGSMLAGFVFGALVLSAAEGGGVFDGVLLPALVLSLPILDAVLCVWRRCGRNLLARAFGSSHPPAIMSRDLLHVHHRVLALDRSHWAAATRLHLVSALAGLGAILCAYSGEAGPFLFSLLVAVLVGGAIRYVAYIELDVTRDLLRMVWAGTRGAARMPASSVSHESPGWWLSGEMRLLLCGSDSDRSAIMGSVTGKAVSFDRLSCDIPGHDLIALSSILSKHPITTIVVASSLTFDATERIRQIADSHSVPVVRWSSARSDRSVSEPEPRASSVALE